MRLKYYAVSGILSDGTKFASVICASSKNAAKEEVRKQIPFYLSVIEFIAVDELSDAIAPLNSDKAICVTTCNQSPLTVSFVFPNINDRIKPDLINDINALIAKYGL